MVLASMALLSKRDTMYPRKMCQVANRRNSCYIIDLDDVAKKFIEITDNNIYQNITTIAHRISFIMKLTFKT